MCVCVCVYERGFFSFIGLSFVSFVVFIWLLFCLCSVVDLPKLLVKGDPASGKTKTKMKHLHFKIFLYFFHFFS